jgi:hypothetical protein
MNRIVSIVLAALSSGALTSCFDPTVPDGAKLTCASDAECPSGFVCADARGVCVLQAALDETAPALDGAPILDPERGGLGEVFRLSFTVSEPLLEDPVVTVDIGQGSAEFVVDDDVTDRDALSYGYVYEASGAEVNGEPSPVTIRLVDASENPSADLSGGVITFDFTPPSFQGAVTISAELLGPGDALAVTFQATEPLAAAVLRLVPLTVTGGDDVVLLELDEVGPGEHVYLVQGDEADGDYLLEGTLTDESGNIAENLFAGRVTIDVTAPLAQAGANVRRVDLVGLLGDDRGDARVDLNDGALLQVTFAASEPLAQDPAARLTCPGGSVAGERIGDVTSPIVFVHRFRVDASLGEGACDVRADLVDFAGNESLDVVVVAGEIVVDQSTPEAPAVDEPSAIVYQRIPWGAAATNGVKRFGIAGIADTVEPGALVSVYESVDAPFLDAIGRASANDDGAFALALNPVDRADVFISQLDPAGNEGPRVRVRDVEWIASMGGKEAGSSFVNPHRFESRALFTPNLLQGSVIELGDEAALPGDGKNAITRGASTWTDATERGGNPERESMALAYDALRGRLIAFGGASCSCGSFGVEPCPDTFARKGPRWAELAILDPDGDGQPAAQPGAQLVLDVVGGTPLLIGTQGAGDVWRLEGAAGTSWRRVCKGECEASGPTARTRFGAAHDPIRRSTVIFGGVDSATGALTNETWVFDGAAWTQVCTDAACVKPPARAAHAMTYDSVSGDVIVFGGDTFGTIDGGSTFNGSNNDGGLSNDVWAFDGAQWRELCTDAACAASKPLPRSDVAMAFDEVAGHAVIFGGLSQAPGDCNPETSEGTSFLVNFNDTIAFDGTLFVAQSPAGNVSPDPRRMHAMAWDPRRERVVVVSGVNEEPCATLGCVHGALADTWEWDGLAWRRFANVTQPTDSPNVESAAWSDALNQIIMVGSNNGTIFRFDERWKGGGTFTPIEARLSTNGAGVLVFGGASGGTENASTAFAQADPGNFLPQLCFLGGCPPPPPARAMHAMAESPLGGPFLFGGTPDVQSPFFNPVGFGDSWRFGPSGWAQECIGCVGDVTAPQDRFNHAMALDGARGQVVLFGGNTNDQPMPIGETWEWNGTSWTNRSGGVSGPQPSERSEHTMVFDEARERVIMFGGQNTGFFGVDCGLGEPTCKDTWEWDGTNWTQPTIVDVDEDLDPGERHSHAMAYSRLLEKSVMFGGGNNDTWLYDAGGNARPGHVIAIAYAAAGTGFGDGVDDEEILDVEARFVTGGSANADGATLLGWDVDGWRALATNNASAAAPGPVRWSAAEQPLDTLPQNPLPRVFFGRERTLFFAAVPSSPNGGRPGFGQLNTDQAEVAVRYRLP